MHMQLVTESLCLNLNFNNQWSNIIFNSEDLKKVIM